MKDAIDINVDLGEGNLTDAQMMPLISSCNIACGGHFGNETTMQTAVKLAKKYQVKVGAHPSFPDLENFGRKLLTITKQELSESIFQQLLQFYAVCESEGVTVHHIKLHGALYNYTSINAATADAVVEGILATKKRPKLYVPFHSILAKKTENLLPLEYEAFIDRRYNDDLSLVSRIEENAVITSVEAAWDQLYLMLTKQEVTTKQNIQKPIKASTYCIHSDTPNAIDMLQFIRSRMELNQIHLLK